MARHVVAPQPLDVAQNSTNMRENPVVRHILVLFLLYGYLIAVLCVAVA